MMGGESGRGSGCGCRWRVDVCYWLYFGYEFLFAFLSTFLDHPQLLYLYGGHSILTTLRYTIASLFLGPDININLTLYLPINRPIIHPIHYLNHIINIVYI